MKLSSISTVFYCAGVTVLQAIVWAVVGALVAESMMLYNFLRPSNTHGVRPPLLRQEKWANVVAALLRVGAGVGIAAAGTAGGQICEPAAAFVAGLSAPVVVGKLFQIIGSLTAPDPVLAQQPVVPLPPPVQPRSGVPPRPQTESVGGSDGSV